MEKNSALCFQRKINNSKWRNFLLYVNTSSKGNESLFFQIYAYSECHLKKKGSIDIGVDYPSLPYVMSYISAGKGILLQQGTRRPFQKGDVLLYNPVGKDMGKMLAVDEAGFHTRCIHVIASPGLATLFGFMAEQEISLVHLSNPGAFEESLNEIRELVSQKRVENPRRLSTLAYACIQDVVSDKLNPVSTDTKSQIIFAMVNTPQCYPTIELLLREFRISYRTLCRISKEYFHAAPMEFLLQQRLLNSTWFLIHQEIPIGEIAALAGFRNIPFYIREFKKKYGIPPGEYRKMAREGKPPPE